MDYGAELRERFESSKYPQFGLGAPDSNDYLLNRVLLSAEVRDAERFMVRAELVSGTTTGWSGTAPATQNDPLDVLQLYGDANVQVANGNLSFRIGRQQMSLGASRLVSIRESPNVRRAFDGIRASFSGGDELRIDGFLLRPVVPESGNFDDRSHAEQVLWGIQAITRNLGVPELAADFYYLGLKKRGAEFAHGIADERRHSVGLRVFGGQAPLDLNCEGVWQWGSFGSASIRAWTLSADIGYTFAALRWTPRLGLKADAISGDRDSSDDRLGTFNPLYPKLPYFSEANLVTPANLLDVQPNLTLSLPAHVKLSVSWNGLWKYAREDAVYFPPLTPVAGTAGASERYIGEQTSASLEWLATTRVTVAATFVRFNPGGLMRDVGGHAGHFAAAWIQLTL